MPKYKIKENGKNDTGRPSSINKDELQKLEMAFKMGSNNTEACAYAEVTESTFYLYRKNNPEFSEKIERWKQNPILKAKRTVYMNLDNVDTAKWYLERKAKKEFSTRQEVTGEDGAPIVPQIEILPVAVMDKNKEN